MQNQRSRHSSALLISVALALAGCSSGAGSSSTRTTSDFEVQSISVQADAIWKLNRPIDIVFNKDVDFTTVSLNTLNLSTTAGLPATGSYTLLADGRTVRFQPTCPTLSDSSDAGFLPGGVTYLLHVLGSESGGISVRSTQGEPLEISRSVRFSTPTSTQSIELYLDTVPGPPAPRVRGRAGVASDAVHACYLELAGDIENRIYFEWDHIAQRGELEIPDYEVPLNQYSITANHIAVMLHLNQPVDPSESNLDSSKVGIQYTDENGEWQSMGTRVTLIENCTSSGSSVRLEPIGILPQGRGLRINLHEGFADLVGDRTLLDNWTFALMQSAMTFDPGTTTVGQGADEVLEHFNLSGDAKGSLEDPRAAFASPQADWGAGILRAGFDFSGSGGLNGNFDWHVPAGVDFILHTSSDSILGGPGGAPQLSQSVINGVVNIRDLLVPANSSIIIQGPNPAVFLCSGTVHVYGRISVDGASSRGTGTLGTTNLPEPGAVGNGGGGTGGTASYLTTQSTPRGGSGFGPFNQAGGGGQGGETSYSDAGVSARRGGGGGGGRLGPDYYYEFDGDDEPRIPVRCQELIGMDAEFGGGGGRDPGRGAVSQVERAQGGEIGAGPFLDEDGTNNFLGSMLVSDGETSAARLIRGELDRIWAGAGGGGGGDAVSSTSFPLTPFSISGDEKGAGAGGGAGGVMILSIGEIIVHPLGSITASGGQGGGGENTSSVNRVGGGSGGGSGGHIVLSSASYIEVQGIALEGGTGSWYQDLTNLHNQRPISALGGQGGAGRGNKGGSKFNGQPTPWRCDSIPFSFFARPDSAPNNPPFTDSCFIQLPDMDDELGPTLGVGGDGSPGIIQIHVDDPALNLRFTHEELWTSPLQVYGGLGNNALDVTMACAPPPLGWHFREGADMLVPFYGRESTSQSKWIPLGLMRVGPDPDDGEPASDSNIVRFLFGGIATPAGEEFGIADRDGASQDFGAPLIAAATLGAPGTTPYVDGEYTIVFDASLLPGAEDLYLRNTELLAEFSLRIEQPASDTYLTVAAASYDASKGELNLTVTAERSIASVIVEGDRVSGSSDVHISLVRHFFLISTNGELASYPAQTAVSISFEASYADDSGSPKETDTWEYTNDPTAFEAPKNIGGVPRWPDFIRFKVKFNLNTGGAGVGYSSPRPGLEFFRIPMRFGHDSSG